MEWELSQKLQVYQANNEAKKGGKGKAWAHKIVSSALIPQAVAKQLQETHHAAASAAPVIGGPSRALAIIWQH